MTVPPFKADHIGSLLRPRALRDAFRRHAAREISDTDFRTAQDAAIRDVVRLQAECGLGVVNDGEFRRMSYWEKFVRLTDGLAVKDALFRFHDGHGHESEFTAPYVTEAESQGADHRGRVPFVKGLTKATPKVTMPAPSTMHFYRVADYGANGVYGMPAEFFADLGKVYQAGDRRARRGRLPLRAARRGGDGHPLRPGGAREGEGRGRGPRARSSTSTSTRSTRP